MVTFNESLTPMQFFVTTKTQLEISEGAFQLPIWRYAKGSENNAVIGNLKWSSRTQSGELKVDNGHHVEAILTNCH